MSKNIVGNFSELDIPPLNPKQASVILSLAQEILYGGAVFGGKSFLLRIASILYASIVPGIRIYLFRRLTQDLKRNHFEGAFNYHQLLAPWIDTGYAKIINSAPYEIRFGNGSKIFLNHCQYLHNAYDFSGVEIHVFLGDEVTHFEPEMYKFLRTRVRLGGLRVDVPYITKVFNDLVVSWGLEYKFSEKQMQNYFPKMILGTNPGSLGHNYFKSKFVDAAPHMEIWKAPVEEGGMYRQFIPARYTDNAYGMKNDPGYIDRVRGIGDPEFAKALINGDWNTLSGGAFTGVWDEAINVVEPFKIPETWYVDRTFDWGSAKPFSTGYWAMSNGDTAILSDGSHLNVPPGTLFRISEYYGSTVDDLNKGLELSSFEVGVLIAKHEIAMGIHKRIRPGPGDSSIFDLTRYRYDYTSIHEELLSGYNSIYFNVEKRKRGELFVPADKSPGSRIKGLEVMRTMMRNASKEPMEDKGFFVFNTCRAFIQTVPSLPRDKRNIEDVDTDGIDHCYDESRYRCLMQKIEIKQISKRL